MRDLPEEMADRVESGAATMANAWILTRQDGERRGFTDHDQTMVVEGVVCQASSAWTAGASEGGVGAVGAIALGGALDETGLSESEILLGSWDQSVCDCWRVDWQRPDLRVRLWRGSVARIRREGLAFVADLEGPLAALERIVGRTYGRGCDAVLGDGRCRVDRAAFTGLDCDKAWSTCTAVFGNGANFQGFPTLPGEDFLTAYPAEGGRHDGGRRG